MRWGSPVTDLGAKYSLKRKNFSGHPMDFSGYWSSKVTDFGTNRKLICDFLLVINNNLAPILHRFRDTAFDRSKIAIFGYPSCV